MKRKYSSGNLWKGVAIGSIVPVIGAILGWALIDFMAEWNWGRAATDTFSTRTISLIGLIFNLIPFHFFMNRGEINTVRGILFPTMIFALAWFFYFRTTFFS